MKMANIVQDSLGKLSYIQIYSNILDKSIHSQFIWIFIHDLFIMPNIFGYSFIQYLW